MSPCISIIVPIYNTESYLRRCIESVLSQTFTDFELLLIDDGSTDRSGEICDEYARMDNRVRVFHKENGGVSSARNLGLDNTRGKWILFVDPDDYWYIDTTLEQLCHTAVKNDADVVRGEYKAVDENGNLLFSHPVSKQRMRYANRIIMPYEFLKYAIHGEFFSWLMLFKREAIGDLRFKTGMAFLEDMHFLARLANNLVRCIYMPGIRFYAYRKHAQSISNKIDPMKLEDSISICRSLHRMSLESCDIKLREYLQSLCRMRYYSTIKTIASDEYLPQKERYIKELESLHDSIMTGKWIYGHISPTYVIQYFRLRSRLSRFKQRLKKCFSRSDDRQRSIERTI